MENSGDTFNINNNGVVVVDSTLLHINRSSHLLLLLPWFEVRVFYVRINNISSNDDDSSPKCLTVNHIPLSPDALLEVNGVRCGIMYSESVPTFQLIRRRRSVVIADHHHKKKSQEEATFVSTDRIRFTGSIRFEVFNKDELILSGVLEMTSKTKRWNMKCEDHHAGGNGFFFKQHEAAPTMEVFVAGSFSGSPVILTKTVRILRNKNNIRKELLDSIPEFETSYDTTTAHKQDLIHHHHHHPLQVTNIIKPKKQFFCYVHHR
ncbi:uncharacterized protein At1g01500-like [Impatiens glandulifera]|uniref:uncharacterized protein At1g01500-like n=1 Tax=Impatiens glandulifera TaxID=253017 RepID=UPI001FB09815|nr:uncharacterized protein At1g01500-like [Impatiens glandulifera]